MAIERTFDVVVIGTGIVGLSTAYHLQRLGVHRLALAGPGPQASASSQAAGFISGGQPDNFTRVSQAHTLERAAALWRFGEDWMWEPGTSPPVQLVDRETGRAVRPVVVDENTGQRLDLRHVRMAARKRSEARPADS